jgi:tight adherence protein B
VGDVLAPLAIAFGGALAVGFIFSSFWRRIAEPVQNFGSYFAHELDVADFSIKSVDLGYAVLTIGALIWFGIIVIVRPQILLGALMLLVVFGFAVYGVKLYLQICVQRRIRLFGSQLEVVFRSISSALRIGLGFRQALLLVAEQSKDPARKELTRALGAANLGTSIFDALDEMSKRLPMRETQMFARVVRIQSNSGGDLAQILDSLAETIRDRRRLQRRVGALTAQSQASAWILGALPLLLLAFVYLTQPGLRYDMLHTGIGQASLGLGLGLDAAAVIVLVQLTRFEV